MTEPYDTEEWHAWAEGVNARLLPMIQESAATLSLFPSDGGATSSTPSNWACR